MKEWNQLGLVSELLDSVTAEMALERPTKVQQMVIPQLLQSQSLAFLSATGSGKTLAYCLPLLQLLKSHETFHGYERRPQRPRLLVLAPTRELAAQIHSVVKSLCHSIKLSSAVLVGGEDAGKQRKRLSGPVDIVVSTPGRLLKHWNAGHVFLGEVTHVVVDEMDTMLEQGFERDLQRILYPVLYHKQPYQSVDPAVDYTEKSPRLVLTSATLTQAVQKMVGDTASLVNARKHYQSAETAAEVSQSSPSARLVLPRIRVLQTPGLHKAVPLLKQMFISVGTEDKLNLLVDQVLSARQITGDSQRLSSTRTTTSSPPSGSGLTMIFCNTASSCRAVQFALQESGVPSLACHGELNSAMRMEQLSRFRQAGIDLARRVGASRDEDHPRILVCTDLVARGLDVPQVDRVIMFDFPLNSLDYLHRIGRTARANNAGSVAALVTKRDQVLASAIQAAVQRGDPLDGLSSRKTDYQPGGRLHNRGSTAASANSATGARRGSRSGSRTSRAPSSGKFSLRNGSPATENNRKSKGQVAPSRTQRRSVGRSK
jgi:superfamily II DNA/RNA helicase